jgi:hypothetical protein
VRQVAFDLGTSDRDPREICQDLIEVQILLQGKYFGTD